MKHYPFIIGSEEITHGKLELIEPATAKAFATVAEGTLGDVNHAVEVAKDAQCSWGRFTPAERQHHLLQWANILEQQSEELSRLESQNAGKPIRDARGEVGAAIDCLRYFAGIARRSEGISAGTYWQGTQSFIRREPIGVIAVITPWNFPLLTAISLLSAAIAPGNSVVVKPAPNTPITIIEAVQLALRVGFPAGIVNVVTGNVEVGEALVTHPDVGMIAFTGSTRTGQRVAELAAKQVKRTTLELGGKAPFLVFEDADMQAAVAGATWAAYANAGQSCTAATRIYVQEKVFDEFIGSFIKASQAVNIGELSDETTEMGPLSNQAQLEKVESYITWAKENNVLIELGGERLQRPGFYYAPTILVNAPQNSKLVQEEIFGPVVTVHSFHDEVEAIHLANDTPYGLSASVWTKDINKAMRVTTALQSGTVWINTHGPLPAELPHGGFKQSGVGKDQSHYALEQYTIPKHVTVQME